MSSGEGVKGRVLPRQPKKFAPQAWPEVYESSRRTLHWVCDDLALTVTNEGASRRMTTARPVTHITDQCKGLSYVEDARSIFMVRSMRMQVSSAGVLSKLTLRAMFSIYRIASTRAIQQAEQVLRKSGAALMITKAHSVGHITMRCCTRHTQPRAHLASSPVTWSKPRTRMVDQQTHKSQRVSNDLRHAACLCL